MKRRERSARCRRSLTAAGEFFGAKTKIGFCPGAKRSADRCRYGRHKLDLQRDTRHAPAITTTVNDVSLLARRASSNLIALGQDVGTMRDKREGGKRTVEEQVVVWEWLAADK